MSSEKPMSRIPEENRLPLKIIEQAPLAVSGESDVRRVAAEGSKGKAEVALKQVRREAFASDEEMKASKEFYEFLKAFPGFGKFVPETLYFKAQMTKDDNPQAFVLQEFLKGRTIDQISDEELYQDPEVVKQLLEFAHAAVAILQETRAQGTFKPDFGVAGTANAKAQQLGNTFGNSRYTTNLLVTNVPDEHGRRVFFIDTGVQAEERVDKVRQVVERHVMGRMREFNFNRWIKNLEEIVSAIE